MVLFATGAAAAASDIGAYIAGKTFGRHRLAPTLSPNKTVEGLPGNLAGAALALVAAVRRCCRLGPPALAAMALVIAVPPRSGATCSSRRSSARSGSRTRAPLLPGFGGMLDRIDSFIVAVPLVYYLTGVLRMTHHRCAVPRWIRASRS